jgi:hypothetical protein
MALLSVVLVVVSIFSGIVVVVVVVVFCSGVPAGAWANATVTKATLITTVSAIINTFFMFFLLLDYLVLHLIQGVQCIIYATETSRWRKKVRIYPTGRLWKSEFSD